MPIIILKVKIFASELRYSDKAPNNFLRDLNVNF